MAGDGESQHASVEIIAREEERLARRAGQCIGKDVAEIQPRGMPSFAESAVRPSRLRHVLRVDGDHYDLGLVDQGIEFASARLALPGLYDQRRLEQRGRRNQASRVFLHRCPKLLRLRLVEQ